MPMCISRRPIRRNWMPKASHATSCPTARLRRPTGFGLPGKLSPVAMQHSMSFPIHLPAHVSLTVTTMKESPNRLLYSLRNLSALLPSANANRPRSALISDAVFVADSTLIDNEPTHYADAIASVDSALWCVAVETEMAGLHKNNTWSLVERPKGRKAIRCRWTYTIVHMPDDRPNSSHYLPAVDICTATPRRNCQIISSRLSLI